MYFQFSKLLFQVGNYVYGLARVETFLSKIPVTIFPGLKVTYTRSSAISFQIIRRNCRFDITFFTIVIPYNISNAKAKLLT